MSRRTLVLLACLSIPLFGLAAAIVFYLPATAVVLVTGTASEPTASPSAPGPHVIARAPETGRVLVFRNDDTRWGWPPYFKFDSGTIASQAVNFARSEPGQTVLATYYGWRVPALDLYPNLVGLRAVPPGYRHVPVFNLLVASLLAGGIGWLAWRIRRRRRRAFGGYGRSYPRRLKR